METDTSCLPLRGRIGDGLRDALGELCRSGGRSCGQRKSKKESGEVDHDVQVGINDNVCTKFGWWKGTEEEV